MGHSLGLVAVRLHASTTHLTFATPVPHVLHVWFHGSSFCSSALVVLAHATEDGRLGIGLNHCMAHTHHPLQSSCRPPVPSIQRWDQSSPFPLHHIVHAIGNRPRGQNLHVGATRPHNLHGVVHVVDVPNSTTLPLSALAQTSTMAKVESLAVHLVVHPVSAAAFPVEPACHPVFVSGALAVPSA